jgi:hypothetical protein
MNYIKFLNTKIYEWIPRNTKWKTEHLTRKRGVGVSGYNIHQKVVNLVVINQSCLFNPSPFVFVSLIMCKNSKTCQKGIHKVNKGVKYFSCTVFAWPLRYLWIETWTYLIVSPPHHLLESRRSYFTKPYFCDVPRNIRFPLWSDLGI